ncbi:SAC3/GANP domain-containing protein, putative, partial [Eimeria tenella]
HNARLALQFGDLGQFNQCQTRLLHLFAALRLHALDPQRIEFLCYRLVYLALQGMRLDLLKLYRELTAAERQQREVQQCRRLCVSLLQQDFCLFFRLFKFAPFFVPFLCQLFFKKVQMQALLCISRVSLTVTVSSLQRLLCFSSAAECLSFLEQQKAVFKQRTKQQQQQQQQQQQLGSLVVDCKASVPNFELSPLLKKKVHAMG